VSFFFKWLRVERPAGVALHPHKTIEIEKPYATAFTACLQGVERVLGGIVREANEARGTIEATFGLIDSERLTVTLQRIDDERTRVTIESRRTLSEKPSTSSDYVDTLANYLGNL
jgi:hypothetical protein